MSEHNPFPTSVTEIAGVRVAELAEQFGTPVYVYDAACIIERIRELAAFDVVRYAQKACSNLAILRLARGQRCAVDSVSAWEIRRALAAGSIPPSAICRGWKTASASPFCPRPRA